MGPVQRVMAEYSTRHKRVLKGESGAIFKGRRLWQTGI